MSRLTAQQLQWLNKRVGDFNRVITEVRTRMWRAGVSAEDPVYTALDKVNSATFEFCAITARMMKEREQEQPVPARPMAHSERP